VGIMLMNSILDNIYGVLYMRQEYHLFLVYIDCTGFIPIWNDICLVDFCAQSL